MNLRKLLVAFAITAFAALGTVSLSGIDTAEQVLAGPGSWLTDDDVG